MCLKQLILICLCKLLERWRYFQCIDERGVKGKTSLSFQHCHEKKLDFFSWAVGQQCFLSELLRGSTVSLVSTVSLLVCGVFVGFFCFFFGHKPKFGSLYFIVSKILAYRMVRCSVGSLGYLKVESAFPSLLCF